MSGNSNQPLLPYVVHNVEGEIIGQRKKDGFINATAMCQAAGKRWFDFARLTNTGAFLIELSAATGIPRQAWVGEDEPGAPPER